MKNFLKENLSYILLIVIVLVIRIFVATPVRVNGTSMVPTLKQGEVLLLNKLSNFKREDIVVISSDVDGARLIKRIIALPGEKISCTDGIIYIDNKKYDDIYAYGDTLDFEAIVLEDDEYFVMGDNREVSKDSRIIGPIKEKYIEGTTKIRLYPFKKIGKIK